MTNRIIDKNSFGEDDFDIEYDEDFDDPSFFTDQDLIKMGVEPYRIPEIRANWAQKVSEPKTIETDVVEAKEEAEEESNNKITFTYCTTKCDKKPDSYPRNSNEYKHNITKTGMEFDWWVRKTSTVEELFKLSSSGHTVITSVFEGRRKLSTNEGRFVECKVIYLDSDDGTPVAERLKQLESIGIQPNFWYSTFSNSSHHPKFRVAIVLDEPITKVEDYTQIVSYLTATFGFDRQAKDPLRLFFGGAGEGQFIAYTPNSTELLLNTSKPAPKEKKVSKPKPRTNKQDVKNYGSEVLELVISIAPLLSEAHPWRRLIVDNEWLYGNELYPIATSLVFMDGGREFLEEWLERQEYTNSELDNKLKWLSHIADTQTKPLCFAYNNVNGTLQYNSKGEFNGKDANSWDLVTLANTLEDNLRSAQVGEIEYSLSPSSSGNSQDGKIVVKSQTTYRVYISTFENHDKISTSNKNNRDERDIPSTQLCVSGINDLIKQLREQSYECKEFSVEEKLKEITTIECIEYDDLLELPLFKAFVEGSIASESEPYSLHRELLFGLTALAKQITKDGVTKRTGSFIKELTKDIPQYEKRTAKTKYSKVVSDILKNEVNKAVGANKSKYSIAKCLPVKDNDGIYHEFHRLKAVEARREERAKDRIIDTFVPDSTAFDTVEANRVWLNAPEREIVNLPIGTSVIECCPGVGKSRWAINQIKNSSEVDKGRFIVAVPSHELKNSIKKDWIEGGLVEGVDFLTTPNLKDYIPDESRLYGEILECYQRGLYSEAKKKLRQIPSDNDHYGSVREYLEKDDAVKGFPGALLTTHARLFNSHIAREDGTVSDYFAGRDYVIVDEDPSDVLFDMDSIKLSDIDLAVSQLRAWLNKSNNDENSNKYLLTINYLEGILESGRALQQDWCISIAGNKSKIKKSLTPHYQALSELKMVDSGLLYSVVKEVDAIKSKIADIGKYQMMLYSGSPDSVMLGRIKPVRFDGKKVVITSATPHTIELSGAFDSVTHYQSKLTITKGKIFWVNTSKTSKSSMVNVDDKLTKETTSRVKKTNTEVVVTSKSLKKEIKQLLKEDQIILHYPTPGVNTVKGKSITLINQYIDNEYSILMKALLLGHRPETIAKTNIGGFKTRDGRSYKAYTFVDEMLAKLDIYAYSSTIRQALGRARLIDNAVTAFFLSNKPIEGCEEITINEFFDMVKISVDGNSTTLNNRLNQTESKRLMYSFGLINEDGELTAKGRKSIKNHR